MEKSNTIIIMLILQQQAFNYFTQMINNRFIYYFILIYLFINIYALSLVVWEAIHYFSCKTCEDTKSWFAKVGGHIVSRVIIDSRACQANDRGARRLAADWGLNRMLPCATKIYPPTLYWNIELRNWLFPFLLWYVYRKIQN